MEAKKLGGKVSCSRHPQTDDDEDERIRTADAITFMLILPNDSFKRVPYFMIQYRGHADLVIPVTPCRAGVWPVTD